MSSKTLSFNAEKPEPENVETFIAWSLCLKN